MSDYNTETDQPTTEPPTTDQPTPDPKQRREGAVADYNPHLGLQDPERAWESFAVQAINALYPRLRDGVDFAVGRKTWDGPIELLDKGEDVNIDWAKVEESARKLSAQDPYGSDYKPQRPLHGGYEKDSGEYTRPEGQ